MSHKKKNYKIDSRYNIGVLRLSKVLLFAGLSNMLLFSSITVAGYLSGQFDSIGWFLFCLFFIITGAVLVIPYLNWKIVYDEEIFTLRNVFRRSTTYRYDDITSIEYTDDGDVYLFFGENHLVLRTMFIPDNHFFIHRFYQYRYDPHKAHLLKHSDRATRGDFIFNGNIIGWEGVIIAFVIIAVITDIFVIISIFNNNRYATEDSKVILLIAILLYFIARVLMVITVRIGRHPENYSKKLVTLFFKKESVKIYLKQEEDE